MKPHSLGHLLEDSSVTVFFGGRLATPERLKEFFSSLDFVYLQQTHSDTVVIADRNSVLSGDAHLTSDRGLALGIRTADCLPVLIHDPDKNFVAAIHAGWRGVENEILRKTCKRMRALGCSLETARAWIGPHIGLTSFEVGHDVAKRLFNTFTNVLSFSSTTEVILPHQDPQKSFVDLLAIARAQLRAEGITSDRQQTLAIDTFTSSEHASYRRDAANAGRQVSFIALK